MALKVKAKEKLQKIGKYADSYRYVMMPEIYSLLTQDKVIKEAALRSGVSQGVMQACWDAAGEVIKAWATEGHSVALPGLGTMRFGLRAKSCANVNEVKTSLIKTRRIIFTPDVDLKDELHNTSTPAPLKTLRTTTRTVKTDPRKTDLRVTTEALTAPTPVRTLELLELVTTPAATPAATLAATLAVATEVIVIPPERISPPS